MSDFRNLFFSTIVTTTLVGCGATASQYRPIVDGEYTAAYEPDLAECSAMSTKRSYVNDDVKSQGLADAAIGAVIGAIDDGFEGAVAGAVVFGALGAGERAWETRDDRKNIVLACMSRRGHAVVG